MIEDVKKHNVHVILLNADDKVVQSLSGACKNLRVANSPHQIAQMLSGKLAALINL